MNRLGKPCAFLLVPAALLWMAGCGGSSGGPGSSLNSLGSRGALNVYVMGGPTSQYKQVLATLYKIELTTDGANYQTVYTDTTGQTIDLVSLASTAELLGSVTVPTGTYTQARITFGDHITLVSNTGVSTSVAVNTSIGVDANGQIAITVATPARVQANQTNVVTVDFDLAEFKLVGSTLQPMITCTGGNGGGPGGPGGGGPQGRPFANNLQGTVSNLNGTSSFTLQTQNGGVIAVTLTSTTTITDGQTGSAITLANGQNVIVEGTFDPSTFTITATSVTLNDYTTINHARVTGTVASVNTAAGSFVLTVQYANDIQPTGGTIAVVTNSSTQFMQGPQQSGSFSAVVVGGTVDVSGTFDTTTQALTANFVGLH